MKTKAKKFSHKLLALFLAVVMALTCFTGVITAYGQSIQGRYDGNVEYNDLAWNVLSDEQVATALLDFADENLPALKAMEPDLANMVNNNSDINSYLKWNISERKITVLGGLGGSFYVKLGNVDELLETIQSVDDWLTSGVVNLIKSNFGDVANIDLSAVDGMSRSSTSSCDIVRGVLGLIQENTATYSNRNGASIVYNLLAGDFTLGSLDGALDVYGLIGGLLGLDDGYQSDLVYNLVQSILFNYTEWFSNEEILAYKGGGTLVLEDGTEKTVAAKTFVYDDVLLEKMTVELLDKISVLVTYNDGTNSASRKEAIDAKMKDEGLTYEAAASALGYDPNLIYSTEKGMEGNILLFAYGTEKIELTKEDSLFSFGFQALDMAWKTVLKDTIKLVHVNYSAERGHGSNFDNQYYYWASENIAGGWDPANPAAMYSAANVEAWAEAVYPDYEATSAEEFLGWVEHNFEHDRTVAEGAEGKWSDIDSTTLFNKLRYSPLADYYFDMQTGPINLYFVQLGTPNLDAFFENSYNGYSSLAAALNDCLVAAVKDFFPESDNIYIDAVGDTSVPTMTKTNNIETINDASIRTITSTLVNNALKMVQYVADTTDQNILNGFYLNGGTTLTEANLEEAMIPLLISCIGNVNISGRLDEIIHPEDWDGCKDAEAVAFICLREYLSYVLPSKDYNTLVTVDADGTIHATLDGTLLPMARDAVSYVMQGYVPVSDASGAEWKAEDRAVNDSTTLLDLLNSVVCYYADNYVYKDGRSDNAMGVASLLGICDVNGGSLIETGNTIWDNFDLIANELMPVLGTLQGKGYGQFDSEDLIWNDIVRGVLEISDTSIHESGFGGVSNFLYRLLTIVSAEPIQTTPVVSTAYDLVKDLINGLFGPRYNGQSYVPIPDALSETPFDTLMKKDNLVGTSASNPGAIIKLICNFTEFAGYGSSGIHTYPDSILPGLAFALTAVNSFITLLPDIAEHSLTLASAKIADSVITGCSSGNTYASTVTFKNTCQGVNIAYVDGMTDSVEQLSRYYIRPLSATIEGPSSSSRIDAPSTALLAPGESITLGTSAVFAPTDGTGCVYTITINYEITDAAGNMIHSGLKARDYQYLSGAIDWASTVYPEDRVDENGIYRFPESMESDDASQTITVNGFTTKTTAGFASSSSGSLIKTYYEFRALYPESIVLGTDNLSAINNYGIRLRNVRTSGVGTSDKSIDGVYYYENATVYDDATGTNVTVGANNAIPVFDKATGDLLYMGLYDVSFDGGNTWAYSGITEDEVNTQRETVIEDPDALALFDVRTHVAYTLEQAKTNGFIAAYHFNERSGAYDYIYLKPGNSGYTYDTLLSTLSMRGPVDGFYLNTEKVTIATNKSTYVRYLAYDGVTDVQGTKEPVAANICFYSSSGTGTATINFVIADTSAKAAVSAKLDQIKAVLDNFKDEDLSGDALSVAQEAITYALAANATPLTPTTGIDLTDTTARQFITASSTSATGDIAYVPATDINDIPANLRNSVYYNDADGIYYNDSDCIAPVYTTTRLTSATNGTDPAGMPVTLVNGVYYHTNSVAYAKEWDTVTYEAPYYADTNVQATNDAGDLLYNQVQFKHYNANGKEVRDADNWVVAIPQTSYQIVANVGDTDNRGAYTRANDKLEWAIEYVYDHIDASIANSLLNNISLVRNDMNSNNFDVVTYNKMVNIAKVAESKYTIDISYKKAALDSFGQVERDADGNIVFADEVYTDTISFSGYNGYAKNNNIQITGTTVSSNLSSVQVAEYVRLFNFYMSKVVERGYQGKQLEDEIVCASGNTYADLVATPATRDDDGVITSPAVVSKAASAGDPDYGAWAEDGTLVNEGEIIYTAESWDAYVTALADAVALAQLGNGSYAHQAKAYYVPTANDYDAQITNCYSVDTALQKAEIALTEFVDEPVEDDTITISGTVMIATDLTGTTYTAGIRGIEIYAGDELVATSANDGTFTATVPVGTTSLTLTGPSTIDRTVTLSGTADVTDAIIPIVMCDYNTDGAVNATDYAVFAVSYSGAYNVYCDFNADGSVNATDYATFANFYGKTIAYAPLPLD